MTMPKFTFIETENAEDFQGMVCDPVTGLCGPLSQEIEVEADKEMSEADE